MARSRVRWTKNTPAGSLRIWKTKLFYLRQAGSGVSWWFPISTGEYNSRDIMLWVWEQLKEDHEEKKYFGFYISEHDGKYIIVRRHATFTNGIEP
jgi:hypothetical protein